LTLATSVAVDFDASADETMRLCLVHTNFEIDDDKLSPFPAPIIVASVDEA